MAKGQITFSADEILTACNKLYTKGGKANMILKYVQAICKVLENESPIIEGELKEKTVLEDGEKIPTRQRSGTLKTLRAFGLGLTNPDTSERSKKKYHRHEKGARHRESIYEKYIEEVIGKEDTEEDESKANKKDESKEDIFFKKLYTLGSLHHLIIKQLAGDLMRALGEESMNVATLIKKVSNQQSRVSEQLQILKTKGYAESKNRQRQLTDKGKNAIEFHKELIDAVERLNKKYLTETEKIIAGAKADMERASLLSWEDRLNFCTKINKESSGNRTSHTDETGKLIFSCKSTNRIPDVYLGKKEDRESIYEKYKQQELGLINGKDEELTIRQKLESIGSFYGLMSKKNVSEVTEALMSTTDMRDDPDTSHEEIDALEPYDKGYLTVSNLEDSCKEIHQSAISLALSILKGAGFIDMKKEGKFHRYSLTEKGKKAVAFYQELKTEAQNINQCV